MKYFFTRKLMLVKESDAVHLPPRRLRHARRDVRAVDARPDRQGRTGADRAPRHARRSVLGAVPSSSVATRRTRPRVAADTELYLVTDDCAGGGRRVDRLLSQLRLACAGSAPHRRAHEARSDDEQLAALTTASALSSPRVSITRVTPFQLEVKENDKSTWSADRIHVRQAPHGDIRD